MEAMMRKREEEEKDGKHKRKPTAFSSRAPLMLFDLPEIDKRARLDFEAAVVREKGRLMEKKKKRRARRRLKMGGEKKQKEEDK
jgi:hypothetical protein